MHVNFEVTVSRCSSSSSSFFFSFFRSLSKVIDVNFSEMKRGYFDVMAEFKQHGCK